MGAVRSGWLGVAVRARLGGWVVSACLRACARAQVCVRVRACVRACACVRVRACVCVCMRVCEVQSWSVESLGGSVYASIRVYG